ncbi:MAG: ribonuclease P protein component [Pseudomonadota bacterium]
MPAREPSPPGFDFRRQRRLLRKRDYDRVFRKARRSNSAAFTVLARAQQSAGLARLGLAVSKKVDKRAVARNRLKRQARETFRRHAVRHLPVDIIVIARPRASRMARADLGAELNQHWERLLGLFAATES